MDTETLILSHLVKNEAFGRKSIQLLKEEYFDDRDNRLLFRMIRNHSEKYSAFPTKEILYIELNNLVGELNEDSYKSIQEIISELEVDSTTKFDWLVDETEKFCRGRAINNAILEAIDIKAGKSKTHTVDAIPKLLAEALAVSFDTDIGHDFIENSKERFDYYHEQKKRIPFDIDLLNMTTGGGLPPKTLNMILAGVHVGKTQLMCHMAGNNLRDNRNVLYITMEMSEEEISRRIDANLLDIDIVDLQKLPWEKYERRMSKLRDTTKGKLIVKEYPTSQAGVANFRHLLNELKSKKNFVPEIIYVDYINLCASSRIKLNNKGGTYEYIKAVAEELRGLAVEFDVVMVSATQVNRTGFTSSDIGLEDTAESFGLPATADWMVALISSDDLKKLNQILVKQLKNRHGDMNYYNKFVIGVDRDKMRFYNVDQSAQDDIYRPHIDLPVMDSTSFGEQENERHRPAPKFKLQGFR